MWYRYSRWDGSQEVAPFSPEDLMDALADDLISDGDLRSALQRIFRWGTENDQGERLRGIQDILSQLRQRKQEQLNQYRLDSLMDDLQKRLDQVLETERSGIQKRLDRTQSPRQDSPADQASQPSGNQTASSDSGDQSQSGNPSDQSQSGAQEGQQSGRQEGSSSSPDSSRPAAMSDAEAANLQRMLESMANRKLKFLDELPPDFAGRVRQLTEYEFMDPEAQRQFQELLKALEPFR